MDNKTLAQIIQNNIRVKNLEADSGDGEQWEDITELFTVVSQNDHYHMNKDSLLPIIGNIPIRITIELYTIIEGNDSITGSTQVYVTRIIGTNMNIGMRFLTNTICSVGVAEPFKGYLSIGANSIIYAYGLLITEETKRPKILKVERLMEV